MKPLLQNRPDSGEITNMKEVLEQVKTDKPFLFMSEEPAGGGQGGGGHKDQEVLHQAVGNPPASKTDYDKGAELART